MTSPPSWPAPPVGSWWSCATTSSRRGADPGAIKDEGDRPVPRVPDGRAGTGPPRRRGAVRGGTGGRAVGPHPARPPPGCGSSTRSTAPGSTARAASDWAVHVALVEDGVPTAGAVALPAPGPVLSTGRPPDGPRRARPPPCHRQPHPAAGRGAGHRRRAGRRAGGDGLRRGQGHGHRAGRGRHLPPLRGPVRVGLVPPRWPWPGRPGCTCSRLDGSPAGATTGRTPTCPTC